MGAEEEKDIHYNNVVKITGMSLKDVQEQIKEFLKSENPQISCSETLGEVQVTLFATAKNEKDAKKLLKPVVKALKKSLGTNIYTINGNETIEEHMVRLLKQYDLKLATAESCTGGMLTGRLVNVPGVSDVLMAGFVTYANKAKKDVLGVSKRILKEYGAVSAACAQAMAKGAAKAAGVKAAVSTTGIAGPEGGTETKPVGLVYIGCYVDGTSKVLECHFEGSRQEVREQATIMALHLLRQTILERYA